MDLYLATCIKQCVSNVLKMVCRKYLETFYISLCSNEIDGNSIFDNY